MTEGASAERLRLASRVREAFFPAEIVAEICRTARSKSAGGPFAMAHTEPLKYGFARMFADMDESGGAFAANYPFDPATRDAYGFAQMLDRIAQRVNRLEVDTLRKSIRSDSGSAADYSGTALEVWTYNAFLHPDNDVELNEPSGRGWDVRVTHDCRVFTIQCKSVRYGLGRLEPSDARVFGNMLRRVRERGGDPGVRRRFVGFQFIEPRSLRKPGKVEQVAAFVKACCLGERPAENPVSDIMRLITEGSADSETSQQFVHRFSEASGRVSGNTLIFHVAPAGDGVEDHGLAAFDFPLKVDALVGRCAEEFGRAVDGLRAEPNRIVALGVEATHVRLPDGIVGDQYRKKLENFCTNLLMPRIWQAIQSKKRWSDIYGCLLVFKLPGQIIDFEGRRYSHLPYFLDWRDPRGGGGPLRCPPMNTSDFALVEGGPIYSDKPPASVLPRDSESASTFD